MFRLHESFRNIFMNITLKNEIYSRNEEAGLIKVERKKLLRFFFSLQYLTKFAEHGVQKDIDFFLNFNYFRKKKDFKVGKDMQTEGQQLFFVSVLK